MPLSVDDIKAIASRFVDEASTYAENEISADRDLAHEYYLSAPFGDERDDRSKVISSDVQDTIESIMPDMIEIFGSGDEVARVEPRGGRAVEAAEQATALINYVWSNENDGFRNTHTAIKDALLSKAGVFKVWWDEEERVSKHYQSGLNILALEVLESDPEVEIVAITEREAAPEEMELAPGGLFDVEFRRRTKDGGVKVSVVPPEEFLVDKNAVDINSDRCNVGQIFTRTQSELIEMGFDPKQLDDIPTHNEQDTNQVRLARWSDTGVFPSHGVSLDRSQREIQVAELYLWVDWDDDGVSELRQVWVGGPGREILRWADGPEGMTGDAIQEVDDHPFSVGSPISMPHRWIGRSVADLVMDVQRIKSTLLRQWLDNMYFQNNGRIAANARVDLDALLYNRPGGIVQVEGQQPIGDSLQPLVTPSLQGHAFPLLEYMDGVREIRTGTMRYNAQAPAQNAYTETLGGLQSIMGQAQKRVILMAMVLANDLFRPAFKKIYKLLIEHQDRPKTVKLRQQWVPVDPRSWDADMDIQINVGLSSGTKEQRVQIWNTVLQVVEKIVQYQGGVGGPFVTPKGLHHTVEQLLNALGIRNADSIVSEPLTDAMPPKQPSPEAVRAQLEGQKLLAESASDRAELALKYKAEKAKDERERLKIWVEYQIEKMKAGQQAETLTVDSILRGAELFVNDQNKRDERQVNEEMLSGEASGHAQEGGGQHQTDHTA